MIMRPAEPFVSAEPFVNAEPIGQIEPVLHLDEVSVRFPRQRAPVLAGVSLRLGPGERVIVLGASGSGKSTLLQAITGVIPHSLTAELGGVVRVSGVDTRDAPVVELSRQVGVLA